MKMITHRLLLLFYKREREREKDGKGGGGVIIVPHSLFFLGSHICQP